jgi:hypothetical protein
MNICQSSIKHNAPKKGGEKVQDGTTQVLANEKSSKEGGLQGEWERIKYSEPPSVVRSILDKERGRTFERMLRLEEPSFTITTHFDIEIASTHCITANTLCL